jgi:glyoxylase-like metal-dependent hydrolase (beta-lactamase superfamily II)
MAYVVFDLDDVSTIRVDSAERDSRLHRLPCGPAERHFLEGTSMGEARGYQNLGEEIYCIDTGLYRHGQVACYLVRQDRELAFIDTGTANSVPRLLRLVESLGLGVQNVSYVIPTHVHLDHASGAGALMARCPNATLVVHRRGAPHMIDPEKLTAGALAVYGEDAFRRDFGIVEPVPAGRVLEAEDGMELAIAGRTLSFLDTPGHANHHICVFDHTSHSFFTGDTFGVSYRELDTEAGPFLFAPTTPVAFDPQRWAASLDRLLEHEPHSMFLTHYGRVERPQRLVDRLRDNIRDLADLALARAGEEPGTARVARLKDGVERLLLAGLERHGCRLDLDTQRALLAIDAELNAQGLEVWLERRAKAREAPGGV